MSSGTRDPEEAASDEYSASREASDEHSASQEEIARHSQGTGGDAPAAASLAEREALARGDEPFFEDVEASDRDSGEKQKTAEGGR